MAMPFGVSFLPGGDAEYRRDLPPGARGPVSPGMQQAIQILSMRVPRVVGANPLAPLALLTGPGSGGSGMSSALLERLLRQQIPEPNPPTLPPVSQVPPPATGPPTLPYAPYVPTPQVQPPQGMKPQGMKPPVSINVTGAVSPQAQVSPPVMPKPGSTPGPIVKPGATPPTLPYTPGPAVPSPAPVVAPPEPEAPPSSLDNPWADVMFNPGSPAPSGTDAASAWAQAQLRRRRMLS